MKNLLKKLHIMSNPSDDAEGSTSLRGNNNSKSNELASLHNPEPNINKPTSGLSNWLNSVVNRKSPSPPSSSNVKRAAAERTEPADSVNVSCLDVALETKRLDSESNNSRDPDVEEEYQIQMALELSAKEDPEAVQIEAVKQISLGSCDPENTPAEVVGYRYWVSLTFASSSAGVIDSSFTVLYILIFMLELLMILSEKMKKRISCD